MLGNGRSTWIDICPIFGNVFYNDGVRRHARASCADSGIVSDKAMFRAPPEKNLRVCKTMRFTMNPTGEAVSAFQHNPTNSLSTFSLLSRFGKQLTSGAIALGLSLFVAVTNSHAQSNFYWNGSVASGNWADANNWFTTNSAGNFATGFDWPGDPSNANDANSQGDSAW